MKRLLAVAIVSAIACSEPVTPADGADTTGGTGPIYSPPAPRLSVVFGTMKHETGAPAANVRVWTGSEGWWVGIRLGRYSTTDSVGYYRIMHETLSSDSIVEIWVGVSRSQSGLGPVDLWLTDSPLRVRTTAYRWPMVADDSVEFHGVVPAGTLP